MKRRSATAWLACAAAAASIALAPAASAQAQQAGTSWAQAPYAQQQLDQMLAPIALYPDALLAQVLMAATYPDDVIDADRFMRLNPALSPEALANAVQHTPWDPSVQALTQFPSVLAMMSERLEWTEQLGDAFLAQPEQVMDTVQSLRARAWAAGTLQSTDQQQVIVQDRVIVIEPWRPGLLWVPYYDPMIVFGTWWWPTHPPFVWVPPPIYRPPHFGQAWATGIVWGPFVTLRATFWHDPRPVWRNRYVVVDNARVSNVIVTRPGTPRPVIWRHDPGHGRGVDYRSAPPRARIAPPPPGADPRYRTMPDQRWERPPQQVAPEQRRERPSARIAPEPPRDRAPAPGGAFGPSRDRAPAPGGAFGPPRDDYGQSRDNRRPWAGDADRRDDARGRRVEKPVPLERGDLSRPEFAPRPPMAPSQPGRIAAPPQPSQIAPPPQPSRIAPPPQPPQVAPPPRVSPPPQARPDAPTKPPAQWRERGAGPEQQRGQREPRDQRDPRERRGER